MSLHDALQRFAEAVKTKMSQPTCGSPEDQLRSPFENLLTEVAQEFGLTIVCTGETPLPNRLGRPDYAIHVNGLLTGYAELKAPGTGAIASRFDGHNLEQFNRFSAIPNILYTDSNQWALYRSGELVGKVVHLSGDITMDGCQAISEDNASYIEDLLKNFLFWEPIIPTDRQGKVDLKKFAELLAPLCRMLRDDVFEALQDSSSPLVQLAQDWRQLLFPEAPDKQFADAYAQTVTFALLLGRSEGANPLTLDEAVKKLGIKHGLLSRALQVLTDPKARTDIDASLNLLLRIIGAIPPAAFIDPEDPWLYFYEDFLSVYDPELRKNAGAYYTPVEVVHAQVRLIDNLLATRLQKPLGFSDPNVIILDPAVGTGTYLLGVIEHALQRVEQEQGSGAVPGQATALAKTLYGFELMVGPYAVAELRVSRALQDKGGILPDGGTHIFLTDTLESPYAQPIQLPLFLKPIADQHLKALEVKKEVPVIVCLGNPPYDRHEAASEENKARTGGWVRWGDDGKGAGAILNDFIAPALQAGYGVHVKNLYNLYVYFWRWALWKVFEHKTAQGLGIVSFITASSYLDGAAFVGMREHLRRLCDEIWILDLGGEGRGTRKEENVFDIQTPVVIAIAVRVREPQPDKPAKVFYTRIKGSRKTKLSILESITALDSIEWQECPDGWQASFRPAERSHYFDWPLLTDLMPWQHSGVQFKRTWPIAPDVETLCRRWQALLSSKDRAKAFRETEDRLINKSYNSTLIPESDPTPISMLPENAPIPETRRYAFRSFDRQWIIADFRLISRPRPQLWGAHGERQLYITSLLTKTLGDGPALTACAEIPDLDHFSGRGAKDIVPLYRDADNSETNILPGLLDLLSETYNLKVTPEDFLAYVYGVLAHPTFTSLFYEELETRELRVPITKDAELFERVRGVGARLLWLHTYGERFVPGGLPPGHIPPGKAKCTKPIPEDPEHYPASFGYDEKTQILYVGEGAFAPVAPEVYYFEVSGLMIVQSWLKYRMKKGAGKKSSPLDNIRPDRWTSRFTTELLQLLWILEATLEEYPRQAQLLKAVIAGECLKSEELPPVPDSMRKPPKKQVFFGGTL